MTKNVPIFELKEKFKQCLQPESITAINAPMGNIAYKTGRKVYPNTVTKGFKNDQQANAMIAAHYHNGWKLPVV